jgi:ABC-type multidrug transport system ATPase subunit
LDSYNAYKVMKCLSDLAKKGKTVICSIHQPRSNVVKLFDRLMLLSEGRVAYYGDAKKAVEHFNQLHYSMSDKQNPADYLSKKKLVEMLNEFS